MRIPIKLIPNEIQEEYNISEFEHDKCVHVQINKCMYGLEQAGLLTNKLLEKQLSKHGFAQKQHNMGLWKHHSKPILFTLVVDDFGVKYNEKQDAQSSQNYCRNTTKQCR